MATQDMSARLARMGYGRARLMLSLVGLAILAGGLWLVNLLKTRYHHTRDAFARGKLDPAQMIAGWDAYWTEKWANS